MRVFNRNATENTSKLPSKIIPLAHDIGGEGINAFSGVDINEMIQNEPTSDSDIIN